MKHAFFKRIFKAAAGAHDGPGVIRQVVAKLELERDSQLKGRLDPPSVSTSLRTDPSGLRIMTVNIHMAVPNGLTLDPSHENIDALRDVARFINELNPDLVMVQELRNRPVLSGVPGLSDVASGFAHLMKATQMAYTPALVRDPKGNNFSHYGTGIYTRNGFTIGRAVNVSLPNSDTDTEPRSAGVAAIIAPDGRAQVTVISTHLAHRVVEDQELRDNQLRALAAITQGLRTSGSFTYHDAVSGKRHKAKNFPRTIVLGGDLNQKQDVTDAVLNGAGLIHVNALADKPAADIPTEEISINNPPRRIDHIYGSGIEVRDVIIAEVRGHDYTRGKPTDHKAVIADVKLKA